MCGQVPSLSFCLSGTGSVEEEAWVWEVTILPGLIMQVPWEPTAGVSSENRCPSVPGTGRCCPTSPCQCVCVHVAGRGDSSPPIPSCYSQREPVGFYSSPSVRSWVSVPSPSVPRWPRWLSCACIFIATGEGFEMSPLFFGGGAVLCVREGRRGRERWRFVQIGKLEVECGNFKLGNVSQDSWVMFLSSCLKDPGQSSQRSHLLCGDCAPREDKASLMAVND